MVTGVDVRIARVIIFLSGARGGKIIERVEPDGTRAWACHYCRRRCRIEKKRTPSTKKFVAAIVEPKEHAGSDPQ
jgi:hypothetical protein